MINYTKHTLAAAALFMAGSLNAGETRLGIGLGIQYGGLGGLQFANVSNIGVSRFGLGIYGVSVGQDLFITDNLSVGAELFGNVFLAGAGLNLNYTIGSRNSSHLVLGLDISSAREPLEGIAGSTIRGFQTSTLFSLGYRF